MAPATFDAVAARNAGLIRKALKGAVLLGKYGTAPAITTLVATGGQIEMPATYKSVGWMSEDGVTFAKGREYSEIRGWGSGAYLRRDIKSEDNTVQFKAIETKQLTKELSMNRDLSALTVSAGGEWKADILDRPDPMNWRVCVLGVDGVGPTLFYMAKVFHKCSVTDMDDEAWSDGDDPVGYGVTMSATPDDTLGTIGTEFMFGPGVLALATAMGLTLAP
jgi:hypothetical protein